MISSGSLDVVQRREVLGGSEGAAAQVEVGKASRVVEPVQLASAGPAQVESAGSGERAGDWGMSDGLSAAMGLGDLGGGLATTGGAVSGGAVQRRRADGDEWAAMGAMQLAGGAGEAVQRQETPAGQVASAHTFTVPTVTDLSRIPDPVNRNQAINTSYHAIDRAMTGYLGDPLVSNWFTYGQHASREAGTQIRNLQGGLQTLADAERILRSLTFLGLPWTVVGEARTAIRAITNVVDLLGQEGLIAQAMQLALMRAGIGNTELQALVIESQVALASPLLLLPFIGHLASVVARLIVAIPAIIQSVQRVAENMQKGNRQIYENVAPAARAFLQAAQGAPNGVPATMAFGGDTNGFLSAAFAEYGEIRKLGDEARAAPGTPAAAQKLAARQQKAEHANLLVGMQEQLVILQPIFNTMMDELRAMSGTMVLHDPNGVHPLANNWGDFYTRMGIDASRAPADPRSITPGTMPPLLPAAQRNGTISSYFGDNVTNEKIHEAPPSIAPMVQPKENGEGATTGDVHAAAAHGTSGTATQLPYLAEIQRSFGRHDVSNIRAYIDASAAQGAKAMGARAYATGDRIAFAGPPDLHTAAHEAAHVVQQRSGVQLQGGVGRVGDSYEQNADAVADLVVAGKSAELLLGPAPGDEQAKASGGKAGASASSGGAGDGGAAAGEAPSGAPASEGALASGASAAATT
jgi:Domain of unknown function (DUF4157)